MANNQETGAKKFQRVPAFGLVRVHSLEKVYLGNLVNISCGGLMLKARELPEPDEKITLSFNLLPGRREIFLKAVVVWVAGTSDPHMPRGMGVRFVNLDEGIQEQIGEYIEKLSVMKELRMEGGKA
ncbi:MAG: PilZ domain-containing protein [Proteobacteria bacterium]|nr:PilZ domain-containing protein [Pseudomonadota bacterium]